MGKGNRNKQVRAQQASDVDKYLTRSDKAKRKQDTKNGKIISAVCIILVAVILLILVCTVLESAGVFNRMTNVIQMENGEFKVNKAMMNFFFNEQIMTWYNQYGSYATYFGLDFSKDMKAQNYSKDTTWYQYFLDQTKSQVQLYLAYANAAHTMGLELDKDDHAEIEEVVDTLKTYVKGLGLSYSNFYGEGVSEGDIKDCYEIIYLANKYSEVMTEKYKGELEKDDKDVIAFPDENKEDFYSADVLKYEIKLDEKNFKTSKEYEDAVKKAKERADKIAAAETAEEFFELIKADLEAIEAEKNTEKNTEKATTSTDDKAATDKATDNATEKPTEAPTEVEIDDYRETIEYSSEGTDDVKNWLFGIEKATEKTTEKATTKASETATEKVELKPAEKNDTFVEEATETYTEKATTAATEKVTEKVTEKANDKAASTEKSTEKATEAATQKKYNRYTVTAYCVESPMGLDKDLTRNLGYVVSTDKATIEKILKDVKAGKLSAEALDNLGKAAAEALPEDTKISIGHAKTEQTAPGYFTESEFGAIDDWLDEEGRKPGDLSDLLTIKPASSSGTTYYAVCYFESTDKEVWYVDATNGVVNERFEHWYQGEDGNGGYLAANPVDFNEKAANDLFQTVVPYVLNQLSASTSATA